MESVQVLTNRTFVSEEHSGPSTLTATSRGASAATGSRRILADVSNTQAARAQGKSTTTSKKRGLCSQAPPEEPEEEVTGVEERETSQTQVDNGFSSISQQEETASMRSEEPEIDEVDNSPLGGNDGDSASVTQDEEETLCHSDRASSPVSDESSHIVHNQEPLLIPEDTQSSSRPVVEFDEFIDMESETNSSCGDELDPAVSLVEEMDRNDVSMVSDYADDIFAYWKELELKLKPNPDYMSFQSELQWHMRGILLDWLVQVHERFRMLQETLFLSVNYIDRFLSLKEVSIEKFQLVGTTALFIAAKYEEVSAPTINEMIYMVSGTYTCEELKNAEKFMINLLNYELGFPGPLSFLRRISKADHYDPQTRTLAKYLIEVTIMYESFIKYSPSMIAAAGYYLAMRMLGKATWTTTHIHYSGFEKSALLPCVRELLLRLKTPEQHIGIYKKYEHAQYMNASQFVAEYLSALDVNI